VVIQTGRNAYDLIQSTRNYLTKAKARGSHDPKIAAARFKLVNEKARVAELERKRLEGELAPVEQFSMVAAAIMTTT